MKMLSTFIVWGMLSVCPAQVVNNWIKPGSGDWQDQTAWSLESLPAPGQTIMLTNQGWKAIAIGPATVAGFSNSMTVSNLTIQGAWDTENVLLLNYFGTAVPLTVLNGLTLRDMAQIQNFNSGLIVQSGTITVTNAQIIQDGGFMRTTNTTMYLQNAEYDLTNGVFEGGSVVLGYPVSARFNQYAGAVAISSLHFGEGGAPAAGGHYALYGGYLSLPGGLSLIGGDGAYSSYFQSGGTNQTAGIYMEPNMYGASPSFTLNGGLLASASVSIVADDYGSLTLNQNGGTHIVTNTISISGGFLHGQYIRPGTYLLNGGTLSAGAINLNGNPGDALFVQSNGIATVGTIQAASTGYFLSCNTHITLAGGMLSCSNISTDDGQGTLDQTGGALVVSNLLDFRGIRNVGPGNSYYYFRYTFTGGTLTASNISISGDWIIGDSTGANRITNSGTCTLSHRIQIGNAVEQLGRFILAGTNATIDLAGSASRLSFANSSGGSWGSGAILVIVNWNGNPSGGGAEQLKFGTSASGLTASQLAQITFSNPAGLPSGNYPAKLLSTGALVPDAGSGGGGGIVNNWINPSNAKWETAPSWSLGILPAANQTVNITNAGYKAVNIDNATASSFPASLTVSNLTVAAPTNALSTLLLNYAGVGTPLKVLSNCVIGTNGTIDNFSSSFEVDGSAGGQLLVQGGNFTQVGGQTVVNAPMSVSSGSVNETNGNMTLGDVMVGGTSSSGNFNQSGGSIAAANISISQGSYNLYDGILYALGGTGFSSPGAGTFNQYGGTNFGDINLSGYSATYRLLAGLVRGTNIAAGYSQNFCQGGGEAQASLLTLQGQAYQTTPNYFLTNGVLRMGTLSLHSSSFLQMNGQVISTNPLTVYGYDQAIPHVGVSVYPANYIMQAGILTCPSMTVTQYVDYSDNAYASFTQSSGTNSIAGDLSLYSTTYSLDGGGFLQTSNSLISTGAASQVYAFFNSPGVFQQQSGTHNVTGMLSINAGNKYYLNGGSLSVGAMFMHGLLAIGTTASTPTVSCSGVFDLGGMPVVPGLVQVQAGAHHLGSLRLTGNSSLNFGSGPATVNFDSSSTTGWSNGVSLVISNWNSSVNTRVFFGNNASGLTASQLAQITFSNPGGLPSGNYPAKLLSTGELVPDAGSGGGGGIVNNWINPSSAKWETSPSWSLGILPAANQTVNITNAGYKAVNIDGTTTSGFSNSLTVSNLTIGVTPNAANTLLMNYAGTTTPLRVLNNLGVETNGHVLMLSSGMSVSNALHVGGLFDQQDGILTFTNSPAATMQVEGGSFNLTNGFVAGANLYLGGTNDGYVNEDGGLVSLGSLSLGSKFGYFDERSGTYLLQSGWLIVGSQEDVGGRGSGTLTQNGGTNSARVVSVAYGNYNKNGGSLFAGELLLDPPSSSLPPNAGMTHAGGITVITNDLHLFSPGSGQHPGMATFNMYGGSISANSVVMQGASGFIQSNGVVKVSTQVTLDGGGDQFYYASYYFYGGSLYTSNMAVGSQGFIEQAGGTCVVTNTLSISGGDRESAASYQLRAGTLTASNIVLTGSLSGGITFYNSPSFAITNQNTSLSGGSISVQNSAQQFGRLTLGADSGIYLSGNASLRFADSHTNSWPSGQLTIPYWNGSTNGGGAQQLIFGASSSALTPGQVARISFQNPAGFPSGTYPARILSTGEVVPVASPTLQSARYGSALVLTWPGGYRLLAATNVTGPYAPVSGATSPWTNSFSKGREFFRLQGL